MMHHTLTTSALRPTTTRGTPTSTSSTPGGNSTAAPSPFAPPAFMLNPAARPVRSMSFMQSSHNTRMLTLA
jgi:hypothetical protein